ncbi:YigZ family protein [Streptococcus oricebi]|uniref:YigZ family protein n=1 Tax=Streptococcus oricebi TaxID=1547447 RepID=A0ABS5B3M3_9STRE|nr:YigZ family protein [Streptococcus oricebi]MBP2623430.1 YigZ family protein [Streptococcus oricebi]
MDYKTIKQDGRVQEEIKRSRFICSVKRVTSEQEAREFIAAIKKEHYRATHNCSAFIVGEKAQIKRSSDDGEPSGTAGVPILTVLEKQDLTNICVVVTRYFGGIKLGAGGLIRAYAGSASLALKELGLVQVKEQVGLLLSLSYSQYQELANFLKQENLEEHEPEFTDKVTCSLFVNPDQEEALKANLIDFFQGKVDFSSQGRRRVELDLP